MRYLSPGPTISSSGGSSSDSPSIKIGPTLPAFMFKSLPIKVVRDILKHGIFQGVTMGDVRTIPAGLGTSELQHSFTQLLKDSNNLDNKDMEHLSHCFEEAKEFLSDFLDLQLPPLVNNMHLNNPADINRFFELLKDNGGRSISEVKMYSSALAFVTRSFWEAEKNELQGLQAESNYIARKMFSTSKGKHTQHFYFHSVKDKESFFEPASRKKNESLEKKGIEEDFSISIILGSTGQIERILFNGRGKHLFSTVAKFIREPDLDAETVVRDGIGFRFELENIKQVNTLLPFLTNYFQQNFQADKLIVENTNLLDADSLLNLKALLGENVSLKNNIENSTSSSKFQNIKLRGKLKVPLNGDVNGKIVVRDFECQISIQGNKNEKGMANKNIYKAKQMLSIFTRLFGAFQGEYLQYIIEKAHKKTGFNKEEIRQELLSTLVCLRPNNKPGQIWYCTRSHYNRWEKAGLIPKEVVVIDQKK